jgi:hypothetical protein
MVMLPLRSFFPLVRWCHLRHQTGIIAIVALA